jgi:hypothetical protein
LKKEQSRAGPKQDEVYFAGDKNRSSNMSSKGKSPYGSSPYAVKSKANTLINKQTADEGHSVDEKIEKL